MAKKTRWWKALQARADAGGAARWAGGPWAGGAVVLAALLVFAGSLGNGLVWDDIPLLRLVETAHARGGLTAVASAEFVVTESNGYYRPVPLLSLWIDRRLGGGAPWVFHLTNLLLHAACSLLLFLLLRRVAGDLPSLLGAFLFAVHPVHVESVAFSAGRTDLWAALFTLLAALAWARERERGEKRWILLAAGGAAYLLACLSKEVAFPLPVALLAWDALVPHGRERGFWARNRGWAGTWGAALGIALLLRWGVAGVGAAGEGSFSRTLTAHVLNDPLLPLGIGATYLRLLLFPFPLNAFYTQEQVALSWGSVLWSVGFLGILLSFAGKREGRLGLLALAWMAAFLLPVSGVIPFRAALLAERFLYLPSVGFTLLSGAALARLTTVPRIRAAVMVGVALLLLSFSVWSAVRGREWKDEVALYAGMTRSSPGEVTGWKNLGIALSGDGRWTEAVEAFRGQVSLEPGNPAALSDLGVALSKVERWGEAREVFRRALAKDPRLSTALAGEGLSSLVLGDPGAARTAYLTLRKVDSAKAAQLADTAHRFYQVTFP